VPCGCLGSSHFCCRSTCLADILSATGEEWVVHDDQRSFMVAQATQAKLDDLVNTRITIESLAI
jgi:hypothetical protein